MKYLFTQHLVYFGFAVLVGGLLVPNFALAALAVTFESTPLFLNANVMPGDAVTRTVTVSNTGTASEQVLFSLANTFSDGLAEVMEIAVIADGAVFVDTTYVTLFDGTEVPLGSLPAGATRTYAFTSLLDPAVGNQYQLATMGFDLLIGFASGQSVTDAPSTRSGGGGGGSRFSLFNESVSVRGNTAAILTWDTNRSATSYAVCGNDNDGPFKLDSTDALFGYVFATTEDTAKVRTHTAEFDDLATGRYSCRVASREDVQDDFTVSGELYFTILPPGEVAGITNSQPLITGNIFRPIPTVAGVSAGGKGAHLTYQEYRAELDLMQANREARAQEAATATPSLATADSNATASSDNQGATQTTTGNWWYWLAGLIGLGLATRVWWMYRR